MENDFLNPQKARELVEIYQWFLQNPDKYSYEGLSRKDFLFLVASIGTLFDVENLEQVVKILENIANNKKVIKKEKKKGGETTKKKKTTKDNLDEWVEQARTIEIVAALVMGGIP